MFAICQFLTARYDDYRDDVGFEEFCSFRRHLTDAWQFHLLSTKENPNSKSFVHCHILKKTKMTSYSLNGFSKLEF